MSNIADQRDVARQGRRLLFVALVFGFLYGSFDARAQETSTRGEVVIFRGIVGYWPRVERFQNQLREYGFSSRVVFNVEQASVSKQIRQSVARGETDGPSAIVGYSLGAMNAISLARDLQADDIHVPILVLIDPPVVTDIPSNVDRCLNLYKTHPVTDLVPDQIPIMRGVPVRRWSPRTEMVNRALGPKDVVFGLFYDNHLTIASTDAVQDQIAKTIALAVSGERAVATSRVSRRSSKTTPRPTGERAGHAAAGSARGANKPRGIIPSHIGKRAEGKLVLHATASTEDSTP